MELIYERGLINKKHKLNNMNNTKFTVGIVTLLIGVAGGYFVGQNGANTQKARLVQQMTEMLKSDGSSMEKAGGIMVRAGNILQDRGAKFNDQEMIMMGKDLSVTGKKHQMDGQSMTSGDMMGMTANGNMESMPGMEMDGMKM